MFAHTLMDLQVPDEGKDGAHLWTKVWQDKLVHRWYGQPEMPNEFKYLLRIFVAHHLFHRREVPEWAIGANAWFNGEAPPKPPEHWDFNLTYDIEQLRLKRGGKLPPGVGPLSTRMKNELWNLAKGVRPKGKGKGGPGAAALGGDFNADLASSEAPEAGASMTMPATMGLAVDPNAAVLGGDFNADLASSEAPEAGASSSEAPFMPPGTEVPPPPPLRPQDIWRLPFLNPPPAPARPPAPGPPHPTEAVPSAAAVPPTALSSAPAAAPKAAKPQPPTAAVPSAPCPAPAEAKVGTEPTEKGYIYRTETGVPMKIPPRIPAPGTARANSLPQRASPPPPLDGEPKPKSARVQWDLDPRRGDGWSKPRPSGAPNVEQLNIMD